MLPVSWPDKMKLNNFLLNPKEENKRLGNTKRIDAKKKFPHTGKGMVKYQSTSQKKKMMSWPVLLNDAL